MLPLQIKKNSIALKIHQTVNYDRDVDLRILVSVSLKTAIFHPICSTYRVECTIVCHLKMCHRIHDITAPRIVSVFYIIEIRFNETFRVINTFCSVSACGRAVLLVWWQSLVAIVAHETLLVFNVNSFSRSAQARYDMRRLSCASEQQ